MYKKKICVIGLGYIGLPTAAVLAAKGYDVNGVDTNLNIVENINKGKVHIKEKGLDVLVKKSIKSRKFKSTSIPMENDVFIIAVPTPMKKSSNFSTPNIDYILDAIKSLVPVIRDENMIIIESTIPVGTTNLIADVLKKKGVDIERIYIAHCPERVLPGNILYELINNDRIIGGINIESSSKVEKFYKTFVKGKIYKANCRVAELCKLTENSFRDVNIAFANELSLICAKEGIDTSELINLTNKHPRVNILQPGPGVGGHCIAIDPWFIISKHPNSSHLMKMARKVNINKTEWVIKQILSQKLNFKNKFNKEPVICCFGITFKPNVGDTRESPSVEIINSLILNNCTVLVVDPNVEYFKGFSFCDLSEAIEKADILVFLVKHNQFKVINYNKNIKNRILLDFCNQLDKKN